ncbi:hypothetical protein Tco_1225893 [Tanacetum coccineum]
MCAACYWDECSTGVESIRDGRFPRVRVIGYHWDSSRPCRNLGCCRVAHHSRQTWEHAYSPPIERLLILLTTELSPDLLLRARESQLSRRIPESDNEDETEDYHPNPDLHISIPPKEEWWLRRFFWPTWSYSITFTTFLTHHTPSARERIARCTASSPVHSHLTSPRQGWLHLYNFYAPNFEIGGEFHCSFLVRVVTSGYDYGFVQHRVEMLRGERLDAGDLRCWELGLVLVKAEDEVMVPGRKDKGMERERRRVREQVERCLVGVQDCMNVSDLVDRDHGVVVGSGGNVVIELSDEVDCDVRVKGLWLIAELLRLRRAAEDLLGPVGPEARIPYHRRLLGTRQSHLVIYVIRML